jgi:hypothetical protein
VAVRPEFGPTLPVLLRSRRRLRHALTAGVAVLVAAVVTALILYADRGVDQVVVHGPPAFNLVYDTGALHRAPPRPGELLRLEGASGRVHVAIAVQPARLPPYAGKDAVAGLLPVLAEARERRLTSLYGPIGISDEGRARTNLLPGYQIGFRATVAGAHLFGRDVYVFPDEQRPAEGALVSLRQYLHGKPTAAQAAFLKQVKDAFHSFTLGTAAA